MATIASLLDLFVRIGVDDKASSKIGDISKKATSAFSKIGTAAGAGMKIAAKGATVAAGAIATLSTMAVKTYADYEQLVGGVETLFGAGGKSLVEYVNAVGKYSPEITKQYNDLMAAQNKVMSDADEAYKTAGLSANDYMETVTSFAAALNNSLGGNTQKSAEYANMAVVDMADNANKMGSSMESIQNAYQGFAKQNYTMLDNLKLGYGGTKTEMERLLADASKISGKKFDLSSYADVVEAIHTIQTEMGIAGTTAEEAEHTISGSVNAMKAAWTNWLTGLGNSEADMKKLSEQLFSSFQTVVKNIKPVAQNILSAMTETLQTSGPEIIGEAFQFIGENLPDLVSTGGVLINGIVDGIEENLPLLIDSGIDIVLQLAEGLASSLPNLITKGSELISTIKDAIVEKLPDIQEAGSKIADSIQESLDNAGIDIDLDDIKDKFIELEPAIAGVVAALVTFKTAMAISSLIQGVSSAIAAFKAANDAATISQALLNAIMAANPFILIATLVAGVIAAIIALWNTNEGFRDAVTTAWEAIKATVQAVASVIGSAFSVAWAAIQAAWAAAVSFFSEIWAQIVAVFTPVVETLSQFFSQAWDAIKAVLDTWAQYFSQIWENCKSAFSDAVSVGTKIVNDIKSGISAAWDGLKDWFNGIWDSLFGGRSVSVGVSYGDGGSGGGGGRAIGMDYVPYNGMPAVLHRGEAILNAYEADQWRRGRSGGNGQGVTIVQNIQSVPQTPVQLAAATAAYFEQAWWI